MSGIRSLTRRPTVAGATTTASAPIYVDSDDNRVKVAPLGSGTTTEVILQEAGGASTAEVLTAARTLTAADSGKTFFLALAAGFAVALPAAAAGLNFRFYVQIAPTGDYTLVTPAATLAGMVRSSVGGNEDSQTSFGATTVTFIAAAGAGKIGDSADFVSDGTNWYTRVFCETNAGATIS